MTHLCYTLEEAARKLDVSETVLVRLSQYFKVPVSAYEELGYLSFKGDLSFSDQDIAFFRQVREKLLEGESLETVKRRMRESTDRAFQERRERSNPQPQPVFSDAIQAAAVAPQTLSAPTGRESAVSAGLAAPLNSPPPPAPVEPVSPMTFQPPAFTAPPPVAPPLVEIEDEALSRHAAERSFARYKGTHRSRANKVFQNLMREVGATEPPNRSHFPVFKPLKPKVGRSQKAKQPLSFDTLGEPAALQRHQDQQARREEALAQQADVARSLEMKHPWEQILRDAKARPRELAPGLQTAARLLREKALHR